MSSTAEGGRLTFTSTRHFGSLDGLRAIAVVGTVWHHTVGGAGVAGIGWLGVDLFFVISGFLITTLLLREHQAHGRVDLRRFYLRRVGRIFPAYYLTCALYALLALTVVAGTGNARRYLELLPAFLTYTANWFYTPAPGVTLFVHGWSLSTEEQFYLWWPALLLLALHTRRPIFTAGAAIVTVMAVDLVAPSVLPPSLGRTMLTSLALPIAGGALLAIAAHSPTGYRWLRRTVAYRWTAAVALVATVLIAAHGISIVVITVCLVILVAGCTVREDHLLAPVLQWRPMAYLGRVSYGVYLYHLIVVLLLFLVGAGRLESPAFAALTLAVTTWLAAVSYTFFEMPLRRRFAVWAEPRPAARSTKAASARGMTGRVPASVE